VQCHDAITTAIGPQLMSAMHTQAPHASLRLLPEAMVDTLDLRYGHVDLDIGSAAPELPEIPSETLAEDHFIQQVPPAGTGWTPGRER
jgi:hypothetical protein